MAHRFIAGDSPKAARGELRRLWRAGIASTVDLLGEATVTAAEADRYRDRCADALAELASGAADWTPNPTLEHDSIGDLPRANLSVKVTALTPLLRAAAPERGVEDAATRLRPLLRDARELGAHLHIDMEALDALETTVALILDLLSEPEFRDGPSAGLVLQAYLRDSPTQLDRILAWANGEPRRPPVTVRLVKGAYWDHEVAEARQHGWTVPVFTDKAECDRNFETLTATLLEARPAVRVAVGSHNLRSVAHAIARNRCRARATQTSSSRCCADSATTSPRAWPPRGCGSASTRRWANWSLGWPTWSAGCSRTPRTSRSSVAQAEGASLDDLLATP